MYVGNTYARLVYSWYQNIFHVIAVLIVFHAGNEKTRKKTILKQYSKSRKEDQTLLSFPIHLAHFCSAVAPLSLRYRSAVALLSILCRTAVAPLSHRCLYAVAPLLLRCPSAVAPLSHRYRSAVAPPMSLRCRSAVAPLLRRYCSTVAPLLLLLLSLHCQTAITPVLLHCRSVAVAPDVATQSHRYHAVVAPLSNRYCSGPERV